MVEAPADKIVAYGSRIAQQIVDTPAGPRHYWRRLCVYATSYKPESNSGNTRTSTGGDAGERHRGGQAAYHPLLHAGVRARLWHRRRPRYRSRSSQHALLDRPWLQRPRLDHLGKLHLGLSAGSATGGDQLRLAALGARPQSAARLCWLVLLRQKLRQRLLLRFYRYIRRLPPIGKRLVRVPPVDDPICGGSSARPLPSLRASAPSRQRKRFWGFRAGNRR